MNVVDVPFGEILRFSLLGLWHLDALALPLQEAFVCSMVGLVVAACERPLQLHKAAIGVAVDIQASLELSDFHFTRADQLVDLCADLVAVPFIDEMLVVVVVIAGELGIGLNCSIAIQIDGSILKGFPELLGTKLVYT